jgi:pentatricopeptide repeat protein
MAVTVARMELLPSTSRTHFYDAGLIPEAASPKWKSESNNVKQGIIPHDSNSYASLFQACNNTKQLKQVHAHMLRSGIEHNPSLTVKLVSMYAIYGSMENAYLIFSTSYNQNTYSWNVMIRGYATHGLCDEALRLYYLMRQEGIHPDKFTFPVVLKACAGLSALQEGKEIHNHLIRLGFESDVFVGTALINMYAKCGSIEDAHQVLDKMPTRDVVSWSAMIAGYVHNGHWDEALPLFHQMQQAGMDPNSVTMISVLQACAHLGDLQQGKLIHDYIIQRGFKSDICMENSLMDMYAKCGSIETAQRWFDKISNKNVVSWNIMISGYVQNGLANEALILFHRMNIENVIPNCVTVASMLQACAHLASLQQGMSIHGYILRSNLEVDVFVGNSLIDMYVKCGNVEIAQLVFDKMSTSDVVSWSAMITGYTQSGHTKEALSLFQKMQLEGLQPNSVTMATVLPACAHLKALPEGKCIHGCIIRSGFESDVIVSTALVDMYAKCGSMEIANQLFNKMPERDTASWNAMITGYAQNGQAHEALTLFHHMQEADLKADSVTIVGLLTACSHLAALQRGNSINGYIVRNGFDSDVIVGTALIDMYAKCGNIDVAQRTFDKISKKDVIPWSAMIAGYGMHGHCEEALHLFSKMLHTGVRPDHITFQSVLSACSHAGLVDEGMRYFDSMVQDYGITPRVEHFACMIDLLGRAGCLSEAQEMIERMPLKPNISVWGALLGACRLHHNIKLAQYVAERLFELDPKNVGYYVLLSNIYAAAGRWNDVVKVRTMMKELGLKKTPGRSSILVNKRVHAFFIGDRSHPQSENVYATLETLAGQMKEAGYIPNTDFVLHDVEEEVKGHMLSNHSEKLAIAFGLINTSPGTAIRITKNLRVCDDCHNATKFISNIVRREIIVRDANRFHYFMNGLCSCRDYW